MKIFLHTSQAAFYVSIGSSTNFLRFNDNYFSFILTYLNFYIVVEQTRIGKRNDNIMVIGFLIF